MKTDFGCRFAGGAFVAAGLMMWLGWLLLPAQPGAYLEPGIFDEIKARFHIWIWLYRLHLFGMITTVIALFAMAALVAESPSRVLVWPGVAVASAGMVVGALGAAFYYHHGAWGALSLDGTTSAAKQAFVDNLRVDTEYVTCLVRFGRVFGGLGLVLFAWGGWRYQLLPRWSSAGAGIIGLIAMALTMGLPDHLSYYRPVFYALVMWLIATGITLWRSGLRLDVREPVNG